MVIKNKLLDIRLEKKYKLQKDFAEYLGISEKDYCRIEGNKKQVTLETAIKIAEKLDMKVEDIFKIEEP